VLARCPLEPRRSIYLVETAGRCFLVGAGEGPMTMLAEVSADEVKAHTPAAEPSAAAASPRSWGG
jgi:flagellar biogenesis protein FliO